MKDINWGDKVVYIDEEGSPKDSVITRIGENYVNIVYASEKTGHPIWRTGIPYSTEPLPRTWH